MLLFRGLNGWSGRAALDDFGKTHTNNAVPLAIGQRIQPEPLIVLPTYSPFRPNGRRSKEVLATSRRNRAPTELLPP